MPRGRKYFDSEAWQRADDALKAADPSADDATLAGLVANRLVAGNDPPYYLFVIHDERDSAIRYIKRMAKLGFPNYAENYRVRPDRDGFTGLAIRMFPLRANWRDYRGVDKWWQRKNMVGIKTGYREPAKQWAIDAMLLGYAVFKGWKIGGGGGTGRGNLTQVREDLRQRRDRDRQRMAKQENAEPSFERRF